MEEEQKNPQELYVDYKNNRLFQERARLMFHFTSEKGSAGGTSSTRIKIPLFENPSISESQSARLGKYKPIGRNSNLYSFLGADSRTVTLTFNITLPHLISHCRETSIGHYVRYFERSKGKKEFEINKTKNGDNLYSDILRVISEYEDSFYINDFEQSNFAQSPELINPDILTADIFSRNVLGLAGKVKALYYFWTNVIRCSVIGSSDHSGPLPVVRFYYGPLYKGVPFIVEKYQITVDDNKSGYDVATLLPNRIKVVLQMEEFRAGNFGKYKTLGLDTNDQATSENVAGWEFVTKTGSLDPIFSPKNSQ